MKRTIWLAVALVVVIGGVVILRSSSDHGGPPVQVSVQQLWQAPEAYQGTRVRTNGLLRVFAPGSASEYFVVEQAGQYRVGVRGLDRAVLEPLIGREVRVEGMLRIDSHFGIFIDATLIEPESSTSPGALAASSLAAQARRRDASRPAARAVRHDSCGHERMERC